ncbi:hypothetical protein ACS0TY_026608 [Phlomoides rotata]
MTITTDTSSFVTISIPATIMTSPPVVPLTAHHHLPIKLTHSTYPSWRAHLIAFLRGHDLLGFIDGSSVCPTLDPSGSNAAIVTSWIRQDQLLLAAIFGSLVSNILSLVSSAPTSAEAWAVLTRLFASRFRSRVNQLKSELYRLSIGSRSITEYLHHVKSKADELALIDQTVSADDLTLFIINGLGPDYGNIVGSIRTRETPLWFEELHDQFTARGQRQIQKGVFNDFLALFDLNTIVRPR